MIKQYKLTAEDSGEIKFAVNYEADLDQQQFETVCKSSGPCLDIAGAGTGKTRTIAYKVARLIESGVPPDRILLVTFTNKAAREMLRRVEGLVKADSKKICGGTFHSTANRVLQKHASLLGYGNHYTIIDQDDAQSLLDAAMDDMEIDTTKNRFPKPVLLKEIISLSLNTEMSIAEVITQKFPYFSQHTEKIYSVAAAYIKRKLARNYMDFDDLLNNWLRLLVEQPDILAFWSGKFEHILVDEFQDSNFLQAKIVDLLASKHRNLMVVGDDAQCIYQWRGANFDNMYKFKDRYPDAQEFVLRINYRSTPEILELANHSIAHNKQQFQKKLTANRKSIGLLPALVPLADETQQAQFVAARILELRDVGIPLSEMAILYRAHWNALQLELELTKRNIPYEIRSGVRFVEQAHIKDVVAYLRLVSNPRDELAWKRILMMVPGIGKTTAHQLWEHIFLSKDPIKLLTNAKFSKGVSCNHVNNLADLLRRVDSNNLIEHQSPAAIIEMVMASDYKDYLTNRYDNAPERIQDIEALATYASKFKSTEEFLADIVLVATENTNGQKGITVTKPGKSSADEEPIILSSIHQAKGLEWKVVLLISACEGCFPSPRSLISEMGEEEERRLFYVAITRTKDQLYVCYPLRLRNITETALQKPSRFISEIPPELFEKWEVR